VYVQLQLIKWSADGSDRLFMSLSRPLRSLTRSTAAARCPVRSSPHGYRAYHHPSTTRAPTRDDRVHPHHLPAATANTKPSVFGQPTSKSHPHLGEHACTPASFYLSFMLFLPECRSLTGRVRVKVRQGEVTPGIPASEYERRRRQLVDGLPDGSLVVCVAGHVKYMSAGERAALLLSPPVHPSLIKSLEAIL
jgi:hypothetical protein